ncbi:hypothetical protein [Nocardia amamiensis]|uniref:hypothetical protein n=1 Tax=Nocardia amamiensis TaxID=404578 RepID=UPI00082D636C|nr:hypothetical protein [Nocardia amamiensis]
MSPKIFAAVVGALALIAGLTGLLWPVQLDGKDIDHKQVVCGNALSAALEQADRADRTNAIAKTMASYWDKTNYVGQCRDQISSRRLVWWPVAAVGAVIVVGSAAIRTGSSPRQANAAASPAPTEN